MTKKADPRVHKMLTHEPKMSPVVWANFLYHLFEQPSLEVKHTVTLVRLMLPYSAYTADTRNNRLNLHHPTKEMTVLMRPGTVPQALMVNALDPNPTANIVQMTVRQFNEFMSEVVESYTRSRPAYDDALPASDEEPDPDRADRLSDPAEDEPRQYKDKDENCDCSNPSNCLIYCDSPRRHAWEADRTASDEPEPQTATKGDNVIGWGERPTGFVGV